MGHYRTKNVIIFFFGIAFLVIVAVAMTSCGKNEAQPSVDNIYPAVSIVVEVDGDGDMVFTQDFNGGIWCFYGAEDWFVGDIVAMLVYDNETETVKDDIIVDQRFAGSITVG